MLALHGGVGTNLVGVDRLCATAVKRWSNDAVQAVAFLEADALVNCGYGSNLTGSGRVEVEAGYMSSEKYAFGAVGCVTNTKHPILVARHLALRFTHENNFTLIPPQVVVGPGADELVRQLKLPICSNEELISPGAAKVHEKLKRHIMDSPMGDERLDTCGAAFVDITGEAEACVSSGGIAHKVDGRLGHSTGFGAAVWAEQRGSSSVAVSVSGCGEVLSRLHFAECLATRVLAATQDMMIPAVVSACISEALASPIVSHFPPERRIVGGVLVHRQGRIFELVSFHNSERFAFAFWNGKGVKHYCSELAKGHPLVCNSFVVRF